MRSVLPREHTSLLRRPAGVERVRRSVRGAAGLRHRRGAATGGRPHPHLVTLTLTLTQVYKKIEGQRVKVNFYLFFQVDQETVKTCLRLEEYGGDDDFAWVILDEIA